VANFEKILPAHLLTLGGGYVPGKSVHQAEQESGVPCIKMASNENPYGPSPAALRAMSQTAALANFYPDNENCELRGLLAAANGLQPENVLVTGGSSAFLDVISRTLLSPGLNAITSERSFIVYPVVVKAAGGKLIEAPMKGDAIDLDAILAAIDRNTRVLFIPNPNNPTGTLFDAAEFDAFLNRVPDHVLVCLDEAYCDFAQDFARRAGIVYSRSLDYVREGRNIVVLRTFSKAHGLAGARVGYGFAPAGLIRYFARMRTVFSVSGIGEAGAIAAMTDTAHIRRAVENNRAGAQFLTAELTKMGLRVVPTFANFLYVETGEDAGALAQRLQSEGIIIRPLGGWGAPTAIRVTIGTPEQNRFFLEAMSRVMARAVAR
jgi:histidinol-phosphate aminotransferase